MQRACLFFGEGGVVIAPVPGIAFAANAHPTPSERHKVAFENDEVRVLRVTCARSASAAMRQHPDAVIVPLAAGSPVGAPFFAGAAGWLKACDNADATPGPESHVAWIIELKH